MEVIMKFLRVGLFCFCFTSLLYTQRNSFEVNDFKIIGDDDDIRGHTDQLVHLEEGMRRNGFEIIGTENMEGQTDDLLKQQKDTNLPETNSDSDSISIVIDPFLTRSDLSPAAKEAIKTIEKSHPDDKSKPLQEFVHTDERAAQVFRRFYSTGETYLTFLQEMIDALKKKKSAYPENNIGFQLLIQKIQEAKDAISDHIFKVKIGNIIHSLENLTAITNHLEKIINSDPLIFTINLVRNDPGFFDKEGEKSAQYAVARFRNGLIQIGRTPIRSI